MAIFAGLPYPRAMIMSAMTRFAAMRARDFVSTLWPACVAQDSEFQRRRKLAVRSAQVATVALVAVAIIASLVANSGKLAPLRTVSLIVAGIIYCIWNILGTREVVLGLFCEPTQAPPWITLQQDGFKASLYFLVQVGLATLIYSLFQPNPDLGLLWLVLLPPVAHSVIFLRATGIALVSTAIIVIFGAYFAIWHGWNLLPSALLAFGFAVLFTLAFTLLAVSAERARGDVERLACELSEANRKLREYAMQAEELSATRERNRLAREIHDTLGHYLTVVNVQIEAARVMIERDPQKAHDALNKAQSLTQEGLLDIRRSVSALRASPLDNKDLVDVLRQSVEAMSSSGLAAEFKLTGVIRPLSQPIKLTLFRAAQEGLTNIQKHSRATRACLTLDFSREDKIRLTVADNGIGSTDLATKGFGLIGLRERAHLAGGSLTIHASPSEGFALEVEVPA